MANERIRIGVDLGGTKIEAIALGEGGVALARRRVPTPRGEYDATVLAIVDLVCTIEADLDVRGTVGIGIPGTISPASGLVKNANSTILIGHALHSDLERLLGREIRVANDADCFAISEAVDGAGSGAEIVFGVIVGTGTGGGIVVRGEALRGPNAIAGEWGHNPLPWPRREELPGPPCYCGKRGCIETFLSGPGLARDFLESTGKSLAPPQIAALATDADEAANACLERYEDRMARGLAQVINIIDPHVIVLGGGMSNIGRLYANVPKIWDRYIFSDQVATLLLPPRHGESSGVRGAAWLWSLRQR